MYNRIYLGRRAALFNVKRMQIAGLCAASIGMAALVMLAFAK
jgi:hypothetical protein